MSTDEDAFVHDSRSLTITFDLLHWLRAMGLCADGISIVHRATYSDTPPGGSLFHQKIIPRRVRRLGLENSNDTKYSI